MREHAGSRGFAWAYWELAVGVSVLEPRSLTWREPLLRSLLPALDSVLSLGSGRSGVFGVDTRSAGD